MATPILARNNATADKLFASVSTEVILDRQSLGWDPMAFPVHIIQASNTFTIEVLGPLGTFGPYPETVSDGTQGGGANGIVVVRGRWERIKVKITSGNVAVRGDLVSAAYRV